MNSTNHLENDLNARLTQQAGSFDRLGGAELGLDQVLSRAGEIKRGRRMRATIVMAACVFAIAVPTALVATDRSHHKEVQPAPPTQVDRSRLGIAGLEQGEAPHVAYVDAGTVHNDSLTYRSDGEPYAALAAYAGGTVVAVRDQEGNLRAHALDSSDSWPMEGDFAVSGGEKVVAFVQPDGTPVAIQTGSDGKPEAHLLPRIQRGTGFDATAVVGENCNTTSDIFGCAVWVRSSGESPETWVSVLHGIAEKARPEFHTVTDVVDGELIAGITDVREDLTTCSAVEAFDQKTPLWSTCDHRLTSFSPDGKLVLATGSVGDGFGDSELTVLDARTGKPVISLATVDQTFVTQTAWEDDSHVLALVFGQGQWAMLRIGLDGTREYALPPVAGQDLESPYVLPSS